MTKKFISKLLVLLLIISRIDAVNLTSIFKSLDWVQGQISLMNDDSNLSASEAGDLRSQYKSPNSNPVSYQPSTSPITSDEQAFLDNRILRTSNALIQHFGLVGPTYPKIALMGSGGGYRAMFSTTGFLQAAEDMHLLDASTYLFGLSGSTWVIGRWTYEKAQNQNYSFNDFISGLKQTTSQEGVPFGGYHLLPNLSTQEAQCAAKSSKIKAAWGQYAGLIGIWSALIGNTVLMNYPDNNSDVCNKENRLMLAWTTIKDDLTSHAAIPMPICVAVYPTANGWNEKQFILANIMAVSAIIALGAVIAMGYLLTKWAINTSTIDSDLQDLLNANYITKDDFAELMKTPKVRRAAKARALLKKKISEALNTLGEDGFESSIGSKRFVKQVVKSITNDITNNPKNGFTTDEKKAIRSANNPLEEAANILKTRLEKSLSNLSELDKKGVMDNVKIKYSSETKSFFYEADASVKPLLDKAGIATGLINDSGDIILTTTNVKSVADSTAITSMAEPQGLSSLGYSIEPTDLSGFNYSAAELINAINIGEITTADLPEGFNGQLTLTGQNGQSVTVNFNETYNDYGEQTGWEYQGISDDVSYTAPEIITTDQDLFSSDMPLTSL